MKTEIGAMKNIDIREEAEKTIKILTVGLDQDLIKNLFDEPIDNAARQFKHKAGCPVSHKTFHKVLADLIVQVYDQGLNARWKLSADPLGEAIALLEGHYQSHYGHGYIAAALDANDATQGGIDAVLYQLKESIKRIERQKYLQNIFATNIETADWHLQCEVVRVLLDKYRLFLPEQIWQCEAWELVSQIPSMISLCLGVDSALQEILSYPQVASQAPDIPPVIMKTKEDRHGWS
jgi:hypothetical protein